MNLLLPLLKYHINVKFFIQAIIMKNKKIKIINKESKIKFKFNN